MRVLVKRILILLFALSMVFGFSVQMSPSASAADTVIHKILTTATPTPVALVDPATITVATSTPGLSITSAGWFDASGKAVKSAFNPETYKIEIHVKADNGYVIASDVAAYLNNSTVKIDVENSGKTATIYREYTAAIWAPTIIKNPSAETVKEGGWRVLPSLPAMQGITNGSWKDLTEGKPFPFRIFTSPIRKCRPPVTAARR